jgi:hypothetical protein
MKLTEATYKEIVKCAEASAIFCDDVIFKVDAPYTVRYITKSINKGEYFRVVKDQGEVICAGLAIRARGAYSPDLYVHQVYCQCYTDNKVKSVRSIIIFHEGMMEWARQNGAKVCVSNSIMPTFTTFNRILSSIGWEQRGSIMYKLVSTNTLDPVKLMNK